MYGFIEKLQSSFLFSIIWYKFNIVMLNVYTIKKNIFRAELFGQIGVVHIMEFI